MQRPGIELITKVNKLLKLSPSLENLYFVESVINCLSCESVLNNEFILSFAILSHSMQSKFLMWCQNYLTVLIHSPLANLLKLLLRYSASSKYNQPVQISDSIVSMARKMLFDLEPAIVISNKQEFTVFEAFAIELNADRERQETTSHFIQTLNTFSKLKDPVSELSIPSEGNLEYSDPCVFLELPDTFFDDPDPNFQSQLQISFDSQVPETHEEGTNLHSRNGNMNESNKIEISNTILTQVLALAQSIQHADSVGSQVSPQIHEFVHIFSQSTNISELSKALDWSLFNDELISQIVSAFMGSDLSFVMSVDLLKFTLYSRIFSLNKTASRTLISTVLELYLKSPKILLKAVLVPIGIGIHPDDLINPTSQVPISKLETQHVEAIIRIFKQLEGDQFYSFLTELIDNSHQVKWTIHNLDLYFKLLSLKLSWTSQNTTTFIEKLSNQIERFPDGSKAGEKCVALVWTLFTKVEKNILINLQPMLISIIQPYQSALATKTMSKIIELTNNTNK